LPRDLNTGIAAKTLAEPWGCLLARPNTGTDTKHQTQEHWSQAFNAEISGGPTGTSGGRPLGRERT